MSADTVKKKVGRPKGSTKIDQNGFHQYMWNVSDRGLLTFKVAETADKLDVNRYTVSTMLNRFQAEGRIHLVKRRSHKVGVYMIADPAAWDPNDESTWVSAETPLPSKVMRWS